MEIVSYHRDERVGLCKLLVPLWLSFPMFELNPESQSILGSSRQYTSVETRIATSCGRPSVTPFRSIGLSGGVFARSNAGPAQASPAIPGESIHVDGNADMHKESCWASACLGEDILVSFAISSGGLESDVALLRNHFRILPFISTPRKNCRSEVVALIGMIC